jgi:outer membrane protein
MRHWVAITIAATLAAVASAPAAAQGPAATNGKIAVVDVARILAKSQAGVAAREQLEREKGAMQKEIDGRRKELEALKDELEKKGPLMTPDARSQKQDTFDRKRRDAARLVDDFQKELEKKEQGLLQKVLQDISGIIDRLGKDKKYYMIVEKRGAAVVYAAPDSDITDEIIKAYDLEAGKGKKP